MMEPSLMPRDSFKQKIFFICDYNKNYHLSNPYILIFSIFYQIVPLNFILEDVALSNGPTQSTTFSLLNSFNKIFLLMGSSLIDNNKKNIYLVIAIVGILFFGLIAYSTATLNIQRKTHLRKITLKKLWIIREISFLILVFRVPIGVFSVNYLVLLVNIQQWYFMLLPLIIFLALVGIIYIIEEFTNENNYSKMVYLSRVHLKYKGAAAVFKVFVKTGIVTLLQNNYSPILVFLCTIVMLIIDVIEIDFYIKKVHYLQDFTLVLTEIKIVLSIIIEIYSIIVIATKSQLVIDNLFISILSTTSLAVFSLHKYQNYQRQQLLLTEINALQNEEDALKVMIEYIKFFDAKNDNKVFLLALVHVHQSKCSDQICICKTIESEVKNHSAWTNFFHKFVMITLGNICHKFARSLKIEMVYLNFKIHFMNSFSMIHFSLNKFIKQYGRELAWSDEFVFHQMKTDVEQNTDLINQNSMTVKLDIIFKEEVLQKQLRKLIDNINENNYKKYSMVQQQFCKLNTVENLCHQITKDIRKIQSLWQEFKISNSFNMKIYEIFLVYNQSIIMSKSTFSDVKTEMITRLQALRGLRGVSSHNLCKYVHNKNACVIESHFIQETIGLITNISSHCENVFQLRKEKMVGNNIHNIMASFMAVPHQKMVKQWMQAETLSGSLKNILNIFFVDSNNNCFEGSIFIKIKSVGSLLTFYAIIIKQNDDDFLVLDHNMVIQGYGRRLETQKMFDISSLRAMFSNFCQINCEEELRQKSSVKKKILIRDVHKAIKILRSSIRYSGNLPFDSKKDNTQGESYYYDCSVLINKERLGAYHYYSIKFLEINKIIRRRTKLSWMLSNKTRTRSKPILEIRDHNQLKEGLEDIEINNIIASSQIINKADRDAQIEVELVGQNMSVSSCFTGGELNIKLNKIFLISKEKVINSTTIKDQRVPITTFIIVFLSVLLIFALIIVCQIFNAGFSTYQTFMEANTGVSNSNNLMEIVYNDIMTAGTYCNTTSPIYQAQRCQFLLESAFSITSQFYNIIVNDFRNYLTNTPSFTTLHYYQAFEMNITFQLVSHNLSITARQFMEQFYYLLQQAEEEISLQINNEQFRSSDKLQLLLGNWQTLRSINHNAIDFYKQAGLDEINLITKYMVVGIGFIYILMLLLILSWRSFKIYMEQKKQNIARVHGIITSTQCEQLKKAVVISFNSQLFEEPTRVIKPLGKPSYLTKNQFIYHKEKNFKYFLGFYFLVLTALNLPILINMAQLIPNTQQLMQTVSQLLYSQKAVLQNYQQLKNAYFFGTGHINEQITALIQQMSSQREPTINTMAKTTINILSSDPDFNEDMNKLFNDDICSLNNETSTLDYYNQYCGSKKSFGILPQGLISAATLIERQTYSTLLQLSQAISLNSSFIDKEFNISAFSKMDDYQIYLSRVYKQIQQQIIYSLGLLINQTYSTIMVFSVLQIVILGVGVIIWLTTIRREKQVLSNLYGVVLQFPQALLQDNRWHIKTIEQNLKFDL